VFDDRTVLKMDRSFTPLTIKQIFDPINQIDYSMIPAFKSKNNNFQDHTWDGFYTGQKRLNRFPAIVQ